MGLSAICSAAGLPGSGRVTPWSTRSPRSFTTSRVLKAGSRFWVNQARTWVGAALTVLPTRGSARSKKAWPQAGPATASAQIARRRRAPSSASKERSADRIREDVVEEEVDLGAEAHVLPRALIDGDHGLEA